MSGPNDHKQITDTAATGGGGFYATALLINNAGHILHQAAREEVGIDGVLELRNEKRQAYGALLLVQIKALGEVEATRTELRYTPTPRDAAYVEYQPLPFLLVVAHPSRSEAWWRCLQDAWADPRSRASRTVVFDRERDRLDSGSSDALRAAFERHRPRHDRSTRPVLDNPFHAYGAGAEYDVASALSRTADKDRAAEAWEAVDAVIRKRDDVPPSLRIALLERRVGEQLWAKRTRSSALLRVALAEAKLAADMPGSASDLELAYLNAAIQGEPEVVRLDVRTRAVKGQLNRLREVVSRPTRRMSERRPLAATLCDALLLQGEPAEAARVARPVLPARRLAGADGLALALDELDASSQIGQRGVWSWDDLLAHAARAGPYWHATVLQRHAVWYAREGDAKAAQAVLRNAARIWATIDGADEQVGEALLSEDLAGQMEGWLTGVLPPGTRGLIVQLGGSADIPAGRGERLTSLGLAQMVHQRLGDAVESLRLAAMVHRRAGNLSALLRAYGNLAKLAIAQGDPGLAVRWWVLAGAGRQAAECAALLGRPAEVIPQLRLHEYAAPWELSASLTALEPIADHLTARQTARLAHVLLVGARGERALPGANPTGQAITVLAAVADRLPTRHFRAATDVLSLAIGAPGPEGDAAARGLASLAERGVGAAGAVLFRAILAGQDLPVAIPGWIRGSDEQTQAQLVDAALAGNTRALVEAVWADLPEAWPRLRPGVDAAVRRRLDASGPGVQFGSHGLEGWTESAAFACHASAGVRDNLIDRATAVLGDESQDDYSAVAALVALARVAPAVPPGRAARLFDEIVGLARGERRDAVERDRRAPALPLGALQATAVQACSRLAARSGARAEEAEQLLRSAAQSAFPEVQRIARAETAGIGELSEDGVTPETS